MVHYYCPHTHQYKIVNRASVYQRVMTNIYIAANYRWRRFKGTMHHYPVLDVGILANPDVIYVTPHHRVKPYRTMHTQFHIPYDRSIFSNKTIFSYPRVHTLYGKNQWHNR